MTTLLCYTTNLIWDIVTLTGPERDFFIRNDSGVFSNIKPDQYNTGFIVNCSDPKNHYHMQKCDLGYVLS